MATVLLQGEVLDGLISHALAVGYAQVVDDEQFRVAEALKGALVRRPRRGQATRQALATLLLYDEVLLDIDNAWFGAISLEPLLREGLVRLLPESPDPYMRALGQRRWEEPVFSALAYYRPLLLPRLSRLLKSSGSFERLDRVCEKGGVRPNYNIRRRFTETLYDFLEAGQDLEQMKESRSLGAALFLPWHAACSGGRDPLDHDVTYVQLIRTVILDCHYLDYSALNQAPIVGDYKAQPMQPASGPEDRRLHGYQLYRLAVKQLGLSIPRLASIEDVLRLREEPSIRRFRRRIEAFGRALQTRKGDELEMAIREILDANEALRSVRWARHWARLTTYLSLPVAVAELWLGLPIVGPALTAIGLGSQSVLDLRELRHDWVLFGH